MKKTLPIRHGFIIAGAIAIVSFAFFAGRMMNGSTNDDALVTRKSVDDQSRPFASATLVNRKPLPVAVVRAGGANGPTIVRSFAGLLVAERESELSFERPGRILSIEAVEGQRVTKGQTLAVLDQQDLDVRQDRVEAELAAAEALLAELTAGPRRQTIEASRARVSELEAQVELSKVELRRQEKLAPRGATSQSERDSAHYGLQANLNSLRSAKATLSELEEGTRKERVAAQRAVCNSIRARLNEIKTDREDSIIVAPFDGIISRRNVDEGVVVSGGTAVLQLLSHRMEAQIGLPPELAATLSPGDKVELVLRGQIQSAWIDRAEPTVRRDTRTRVVFVRFTEQGYTNDVGDVAVFDALQQAGWVTGEVVDLQLNESKQNLDGQYWLPTTALVRSARGLWTALVIPGDSGSAACQRRSLEVIRTDGAYSLVQGMLAPGERVIASGLHRITAGMNVEPANQNQSESQ